MLQIQMKELGDICCISKLVAKYNINATIANQTIILDSKIPDELLHQICNSTICIVQNFRGELTKQEKCIKPVTHNYDLADSIVKRGEVYFCDFGKPYGSEQGGRRYAIVFQNNDGNYYSPTTIVLPCTTKTKARLPVHYEFYFSKENMEDYDTRRVGNERNVVLGEQLRVIDKKRLIRYIGTMNPSFMNKMQKIVMKSLSLDSEKSNN